MIRLHLHSIDSTSAQARRLVRECPGQVVLVSADTQTAGRGRSGRTWTSPVGGAWFTLAVPTVHPPTHDRVLPLLTGLAVAQTLEARAQGVTIKWPNDVLIAGRKVAGILCERVLPPADGAHGAAVLAGIGINLNLRPQDLPDHLRFPATSLLIETGEYADVPTWSELVSRHLISLIDRARDGQLPPDLHEAIENRLAFRGELLEMAVGAQRIQGWCEGIDEAGRLCLRVDAHLQRLDAGEIREVRPVGVVV